MKTAIPAAMVRVAADQMDDQPRAHHAVVVAAVERAVVVPVPCWPPPVGRVCLSDIVVAAVDAVVVVAVVVSMVVVLKNRLYKEKKIKR
jgi:hypothetical protein